ncbi:MAG: iron-sulfur cluster assembly scaffold protein [Candidatus Ratteibacteria bacterium]|nr:iron-sulfur cluster assembly scaffold protein [Candidatus Ratteibacteria bacterium]
MSEENLSEYSGDILKIANNLKHFGRMTDPTGSARIKGPCGDEIEFYLVINDGIIEDVKFYTDGCIATKVCGSMAARLATGKTIEDALSISPKQVMDSLQGLPKDHCHCSILAVSALYRAIADYLLKI